MEPYTKQTAFETMVTRLYEQNDVSKHGNRCKYVSIDGKSCAIGLLFDEEDREKLTYSEGVSADGAIEKSELTHRFQGYEENNFGKFLTSAQTSLHDILPTGVNFRVHLLQAARKFGRNYNLKTKFIDDLVEENIDADN